MPAPACSRRRFLGLLTLAPLLASGATSERIIYPPTESLLDQRSAYRIQLLQLALTKVGLRNVLQPGTMAMQQGRALLLIEQGQGIDVFWSMTSKQREQQLLPIRIPIDRGLLGWRLLLIRKGDEARFASIRTAAQLAQMLGAQGHDWPDVAIMRAAGLNVYPSSHYESLFSMLERGRVDYVSRSVSEIDGELARHDPQLLAIEPRLALHYPVAEYFFVRRQRVELAQQIEKGLRLALADGSFDALFQHHHADILKQANLARRHIIRLNNPLLPAATPLREKSYWYVPQ